MVNATSGSVERKPAYGRIILSFSFLCLSVVLTVFFSSSLTNKPDVLAVIAAIFAILAAVLIVIISILGDPSMLLDQSWRHSYLSATETQRQIHRQTDIFIVYILLLVSIFVFMLCVDGTFIYRAMQVVSFFLTSLAFLASMTLPFSLRSIQRRRLDNAIAHLKAGRSAAKSES
ncbi:hypothetical protein [Bosea caraganae]|uniref:hypothetical protein n=1 Tax=Bosea caraganae TaxID=2763117 RepID=UPI0011C038CF|nr:hypothetical protein [Bosea caraganae]